MIGTDHYLVVAEGSDNSQTNVDSTLWKLNGGTFGLYQYIPTHNISDWRFFTLTNGAGGSEYYLAAANTDPLNPSSLYRWNGQYFALCGPPIRTSNQATNWLDFVINNVQYLAVANQAGSSSLVYKLDTT